MEEALKACHAASKAIFGEEKGELRVSVELERDRGDDTIVIGGWLYLTDTVVEDVLVQLGTKMQERPAWYMSYGYEDPGVRYYSDGSGQPPSWEVEDCDPAVVSQLHVAIAQLFGMLIKQELNNLAENTAYETQDVETE